MKLVALFKTGGTILQFKGIWAVMPKFLGFMLYQRLYTDTLT
jgi:hypothetical protein